MADPSTDNPSGAGTAQQDPVKKPPARQPAKPSADAGLAAPTLQKGRSLKADREAVLFTSHPTGVATFKAFLSDAYETQFPDRTVRRLYPDDTGLTWVEVDVKDIIGKMPATANPHDDRSLVYVKRDAVVTLARRDDADDVSEELHGGGDPRGGPNARRRPPY